MSADGGAQPVTQPEGSGARLQSGAQVAVADHRRVAGRELEQADADPLADFLGEDDFQQRMVDPAGIRTCPACGRCWATGSSGC